MQVAFVCWYLNSFLSILCLVRWWQLPYYWAGIKMYDIVAGRQVLRPSYLLSKSKALELFPMLKKDKLAGALVYYDGMLVLCGADCEFDFYS